MVAGVSAQVFVIAAVGAVLDASHLNSLAFAAIPVPLLAVFGSWPQARTWPLNLGACLASRWITLLLLAVPCPSGNSMKSNSSTKSSSTSRSIGRTALAQLTILIAFNADIAIPAGEM